MNLGRIWRWFLLLALVVAGIRALIENVRKENVLKATGFQKYEDYEKATAASITDPAAWAIHKAKLEQEAAAKREQELAAKRKRDEEEYERNRNPATKMSIKSLSWAKSGFGTVALVTLTIENMNDFAVKDVAISCDFKANSGTKLNTAESTIYETIKAKSSRTFKEFNVGFIHSQASRGGCSIERARRP